MTKNEIIELIARERRVERLVEAVAPTCTAKSDLSQMVYLALLEKSEESVRKAWDDGYINYLIVAMVSRQYYYKETPYWYQFRRYSAKEAESIRQDGEYDEQWWERPGRLTGGDDV